MPTPHPKDRLGALKERLSTALRRTNEPAQGSLRRTLLGGNRRSELDELRHRVPVFGGRPRANLTRAAEDMLLPGEELLGVYGMADRSLFLVTTGRLLLGEGGLVPKVREVALDRLSSITRDHQTLSIEVAGARDIQIEMGRDATKRFDDLYQQLAGHGRSAPGGYRAGLTAQLAELADLHARGALTDEEFTAAKQRLISG